MPISDAFVVGEDFLSEHYFSSDANNESFRKHVLERRKAWDQAEHETSRDRFAKVRGELAVRMAKLYEESELGIPTAVDPAALTGTHELLFGALGYRTGEFDTHVEGPVTWFNTPGVTSDAPLAVVLARPASTIDDVFAKADESPLLLAQPWQVDERISETLATKAISRIFLADDAPQFVLLLAGRFALVTEQARWAEGRYLAIDLQAVCDRNDSRLAGETDRMLTCLEADSLAPDADGQVWWTKVLEDSVKHTVGVSKDLREGVRRSIEIIANEVVARRQLQGLPALPADQAQPLARQSLRFLYRILFLLYAEASPELGVLPTGAPEYDAGYSLDRLRELTLTPLSSTKARQGTHFYDSLAVLFRLVDEGHSSPPSDETAADDGGLVFHSLRADLFRPESIHLIAETHLGNEALQQVLQKLLLSKEVKGRDRGFISYVDLGINQLGAVYEGLMSYTGFFAETDLYEVARGGNPEKGSWVVPVERAQGIAESDFVRRTDPVTGESKPVVHQRGQFVYRLSGRARQQSASYYTPEVLTKFTVGQALKELLDQDDQKTPAKDVLGLSICEPALGSGAFAIEATRQLAEQYLKRRQEELGERIAPEDYPRELQRAKAYIALHNVYGVDLNATAVEFAEITLWLDTMAAGLQAPWFGLRLRRGNSLIGARRAVYTRSQVETKEWLKLPPTTVPLTDLAHRLDSDDPAPSEAAGRIPHFLLPAEGWGSTADSKEAKALVPERVAAVKHWRKTVRTKPTKAQLDELVEIGHQVDELWTLALKRLTMAEQQTRRNIQLWGQDDRSPSNPTDDRSPSPSRGEEPVVSREQIEDSLADPNGAYQRLRRVMDAWCALWFWPLTGDEVTAPGWGAWISACKMILGSQSAVHLSNERRRKLTDRKKYDYETMEQLAPTNPWDDLADQETMNFAQSGAKKIDEVLALHPWLKVCEDVARQQGFFHWQLDFATVFGRGGFDLQVGNPPWVRPIADTDALLAEGDPWWQLADKPSEKQRSDRREETLGYPEIPGLVVRGDSEIAALGSYVGAVPNFPELAGLQPDLYRCFMSATWGHQSPHGIVAMVHPDSHFTDEKATTLRSETYRHLARHWQFVNELKLFSEIHHLVIYGVHVYSGRNERLEFLNASALYHPETVLGSLRHDGEGEAPGFKYEGHWDQRPHAQRIELVTDGTLTVWRDILDPELAIPRETRMLYTVNHEVADTLRSLAKAPRLSSLDLRFSPGWHEKNDRTKGYFEQCWGISRSWDEVILQGPHLHVATPLFKTPNPTMKHNQDWSATDFESLPPDAILVTSYKPTGDRARYDRDYTHWDGAPARDSYRLMWRMMAANTGERTLISSLFPPGTAHTHGVSAVATDSGLELTLLAGLTSSLLADFALRAAPKATIQFSSLRRLPRLDSAHRLLASVLLRTLRLNCVTDAYADLWREVYDPHFRSDSWTSSDPTLLTLAGFGGGCGFG